MSRIVTDADLLSWEAFPTGGPFGYPDKPKVVFNCLSDASRRPRWVAMEGDNADAERILRDMDEDGLQRLLSDSTELR